MGIKDFPMNDTTLTARRSLSWQHRAGTMLRLVIAVMATSMTASAADQQAQFETPTLEHVMTVRATIDAPIEMGETPQGERRAIPISGGTFEGRNLRGVIMPGGEDWQVARKDGVTQLDARYWLREAVRNSRSCDCSQPDLGVLCVLCAKFCSGVWKISRRARRER
jgi:hypothetical protein